MADIQSSSNLQSMASLLSLGSLISSSSSSSLLSCNSTPPLSPTQSLSSLSQSYSFSSSLSTSPFLPSSTTSARRLSFSTTFTVRAEKKKVLIVNTNSGGHAVIGFYFAKQLLGSGHEVTIMTMGEESSDKMKKPPFSRFSVEILLFLSGFSQSVCVCLICSCLGFSWESRNFPGNHECWGQDPVGKPSRSWEGCGGVGI